MNGGGVSNFDGSAIRFLKSFLTASIVRVILAPNSRRLGSAYHSRGVRSRGDFMEIKQSASEDLRARLGTIRAIQCDDLAAIDAATARNILHEELGYFSDPQTGYNLDESTRNRLMAHTRQDAAHAVLSLATLTLDVRKVGRDVRTIKRLAWVAVILLAI